MSDNRDQAARAERLYQELRAARRRLGKAEQEIEQLQRQIAHLTGGKATAIRATYKPTQGVEQHDRTGTAVLLLSDLHLDEVVRPEEVGGYNRYDRATAERRLQRVMQHGLLLAKDYLNFTWDGAVVIMAGDMVSGDIHEELVASNETSTLDTVVYWTPILAEWLRTWADAFGKLHVVGVVGNHGRTTKHWQFKHTARTSYDWLLYQWVRDRLRDDPRFTWQIPDGADALLRVHNIRYLVTHGNAFRGGDGQVGPLGPVIRGHLRTLRREQVIGNGYDWMVMGHWHTYTHANGVVINGSLKGLDEYAYQRRMVPEPPQQAFWVTTHWGVTCAMPIFGDGRRGYH